MCDIVYHMPYRKTVFLNDHFYHIYNRGVEKRKIFSDVSSYNRFIDTLYYYQFSGPKPKFSTQKRFRRIDFNKNPKIIEIICYCLMPNHFHILIKQLKKGGIQEFIRKALNSYTKYFNTKNKRVGPLFQGEFKDTFIETEEQLLHLSRYIHLNPYVSEITENLETYPYSSYPNYIKKSNSSICSPDFIMSFFKNSSYEEFTNNHKDYAKSIERIKHLLIEDHTPGV